MQWLGATYKMTAYNGFACIVKTDFFLKTDLDIEINQTYKIELLIINSFFNVLKKATATYHLLRYFS